MKVASRNLQTLFSVGTLVGLSDAALLERFAVHREEPVFEEIVRRHGPMVWGVCRRILGDHHDTEDAFQATFLVLARKGHAIDHRERVASWLHAVACQTARKARATRAKRRTRESQVTNLPEPEARYHSHRDELAEWLDRELRRLPDKYRIPIILCELEQKTHQEAADQLGWPIGTVSGRLSRARTMLARRLSRRDVSLPAGSLAALLAREASTSMPAGVIIPAAQAASLFAAGGTLTSVAISAAVAALTQRILKAMLLGNLGVLRIALLTTVFMGTGLAWVASRGSAAGQESAGAKPANSVQAPVPKDEAAIQGIWTIANIEQVSHQATEEEKDAFRAGALTITIRGNTLTYDADKSSMNFRLDPSQSPKRLTLEVPDGPDKGRHVPAIYRLKGDDLEICQGRLGDWLPPNGFSIQNRRPETFPTLWVLRRRHDLSERFRVKVDEVVKDSDVLATRIVVESVPGARVDVVADKPNRGGFQAVSPAEPDTPAHAQLTILADHVEWKAGPANTLKFMMKLKTGAASSTMSDTGPMPEARRLADLLSVAIQPGEYKYGETTKLVTYKDVTYHLVVKRPE